MPKKRKKRDISVSAPDYIPKRAPIFKDTTGTEALDVFKAAETAGRVMSFIMVAIGIFVTVLSAYSTLTSVNMLINPLFLGALGIIGALNILCGLLLLAKK
ncbi:MAG: hypothetical protein CW691_08690 [Candidatus Bathyarchaeum sp.]|nr:MAG: hypothetical protein CW691_08690 [Candidatus Bathyarchaeum sp.]